MKNVNASIITIGDELLIGQVIDTNSSWISRQLNNAGVAVIRRVASAIVTMKYGKRWIKKARMLTLS